MATTKTLLMIAFEFPPGNGASVPRIESFYRYLKQWGWKVVVLTANPRAYERVNPDYQDAEDDLVYRTFALDAPRHLSIKGKYIAASATPDRWGLTWIPSALIKGRQLVKKYQPDVIWSSSPIPSTHFIANKLSQKHGIPWVADYRDPFHYMNGSAGPKLDKIHKKIDQNTLTNTEHLTFATEQVKELYQDKYGNLVTDKSTVIENGFDEANFAKLETLTNKSTPFTKDKFSLYYSGVLYPHGRDPRPVFDAISELSTQGVIGADNFELVFQGAGDGSEFKDYITEKNIESLVSFIEPVPFLNALNNMMHADALLLIQDSRFNKQIPGKIYEYLRTQRPMLVKADPEGATYQVAAGFDKVYTGYNTEELQEALTSLLKLNQSEEIARDVNRFNREAKAKQLLDVINSIN